MNKANVRLIMSMFTIVILLSGMAIAQVYTRSSDRTRGLSGDQQKVEQGQPLKATQPAGPAQYWQSLSEKEKLIFINGAYAMASRLRGHLQHEVNQQRMKVPGWTSPYFVERYYEIIDEHVSTAVQYDLTIIVKHMDALYANSDNERIPIIEALRVVSLAQDGYQKQADLYLLKAQQKYAK